MSKKPYVIMAGIRGADGKDGEPAEAISVEAGEDISAFKTVYIKNNKAYPLDNQDSEHIFLLAGITTNTAIQGSYVTLKQAGRLIDSAFDFRLGRIYLGSNGAITQIPPTKGYCALLGVATASNTLLINLDDPIKL